MYRWIERCPPRAQDPVALKESKINVGTPTINCYGYEKNFVDEVSSVGNVVD